MSTEKRKYNRRNGTNPRRKHGDDNKEFIPMRPATLAKYRAVKKRFKQLFETERRRIDDVHRMIMEEFFITSEMTVWRIVRAELPEEEEAASDS